VRSQASEISDQVQVGINLFYGLNTTTNIDERIQEESKTTTVNFNQSSSSELGSSYNFRVVKNEQKEQEEMTNADGTIRYDGQYGNYSGQFSRNQEINDYFFSYSGSSVFIDGSLFFTRPINDGFALVKGGDIKNVEVQIKNRDAGVTNSKGTLLVPGLTSYSDNEISVSTEKIPIDYTLEETKKYIYLPFRSGGKVKFDFHKFQAVSGSVFFLKENKKVPADFGKLELTIKENQSLFFVGKSGQIYIEDISPGTYPARLIKNELECKFDLIVPKSDEVIIELGDLPCRLN
jgi:outer membrane usher protein